VAVRSRIVIDVAKVPDNAMAAVRQRRAAAMIVATENGVKAVLTASVIDVMGDVRSRITVVARTERGQIDRTGVSVMIGPSVAKRRSPPVSRQSHRAKKSRSIPIRPLQNWPLSRSR
jgi:hypothetical protein